MRKTIAEARIHIIAELGNASISNPDLEADILLREVTGKDAARMLLDKNETLGDVLTLRLEHMIARRCKRVPLAHILGYTEFYGHRFITNPGVLIPRKETEILVERALHENIPSGSTVLDLACGSGCIGLTIAMERPDLTVHLADISEIAIAQTRENAAALNLQNIKVFQSDWFESIPQNLQQAGQTNYYAILTNPPYIYPGDAALMEPEVVDHDPHTALFNENPPELYARILLEAHNHLSVPGFIAAELSPFVSEEVLASAQKIFTSAQLIKDYSSHDRILFARTG